MKVLKSSEKQADKLIIPSVLWVTGWIIIIAMFFAGIINGKNHYDDFKFEIAIWYWAGGFVSGIILIGLGRIIQLLESIRNADYSIIEK